MKKALIATLCALPAVAALAGPPVAPVRSVSTNYFGTEVVDNYRYLEDLQNPEVQQWMKAQAGYTHDQLAALPGRAALLERIHELSNANTLRGDFVRRGQRWFYQKLEPGAQQPKLYVRDGLQGEERLLIDPGALGQGSGTHYALDYFSPSWDGRYLVYGLSTGGSEASVLHILDLQSGKQLPETIERAHDAVIGWRPDNRSFFYLRYNQPTPSTPKSETEYNARTYLHVIGAHADGDGDALVFGRGVGKQDVPEGQGTYVLTASQSPYGVAVANHNMDENPATLYVAPVAAIKDAATPWRRFATVDDGVTQVEPHGDKLYFISQKGAPRFRILVTSAAKPDVAHAEVVVPEGSGVITGFSLAREGLYYTVRDGAVDHLMLKHLDGSAPVAVALPFEGRVGGPTTDAREPGALYSLQGWVRPSQVMSYDAATGQSSDTGLIPPSKIDASAYEAEEVMATSYDGTRVPLSIVHKKGLALDGSHPTILMGYGAYGLSMDAAFSPTRLAWLERGGVYAVGHIRGGGEYGEAWHLGGQKLTKINTILDFIACGQYLVDHGYTVPAKLAGNGGSAGGITVGGAMTWRPDLFGVILDQVGMSDTLRMETEPNGPPNVPEFGTVATPEGFKALYAMGAYMHVRDGAAYPAVMFLTGANDPRVASWHMTKMAARTQVATRSGKPVLLRIDYDAGHGMGSNRSQREQETADMWSFALWQFGEPGFQPAAK